MTKNDERGVNIQTPLDHEHYTGMYQHVMCVCVMNN